MNNLANLKQYNDKYKNVFYEGRNQRLYNELTTTSFDCLYSEIQIKLIELIEKFNLKVFCITCTAKTNYKIKFIENNYVELNNDDVQSIKKMLEDDIYYLYKNQLFEVLYKVPFLNQNNNYYYNILIVVKNNTFLEEINNHNFNLITIQNITPVFKNQITFDFIEIFFKDKANFNNQFSVCEKNSYIIEDISNIDYINKYCDGNENRFDLMEYNNVSSFFMYKKFNQDLYARSCFKLLDMGIFSFDRSYIKRINEKGLCISFINKFDMNSGFLTNWAEISGLVSVEITDNNYNINQVEYYHSCLYDNEDDQCIISAELDRRWIKTGFIDLNSLETYHENEIFDGSLLKKDFKI